MVENILAYLSEPVALLIAGLLALALALTLMLRGYAARLRAMSEKIESLESNVGGKLSGAAESAAEQAARSREELSSNLRAMGESVALAMGEMTRTQQAQLSSFSEQIRDIGRSGEDRLELIRLTMERGLEGVGRESGDRIDSAMDERLGERFQRVSDQLERVHQGLEEMHTIAEGVGDLKRVLTGVRARGVLGEIQLGALLNQMLAKEQYEPDVRVRDGGEAVSFAVRIPPRSARDVESLLPIDARAPQEPYYALLNALDEAEPSRVEQAGTAFERALEGACARMCDQFILPPRTTDFGVLFLCSEGYFAEALRRPALTERLQRDYRVILAGPSTLAALLGSLRMGLQSVAFERRSEEVWALLGAVRGEFVKFADALARTQKRIRQASESIEDATRKSRTIQKKLRDVESLGASRREELLEENSEWEEEY